MKGKMQMLTAIFYNIAGVFVYAVGIHCFAVPHRIAPGGSSGIAILVNALSGCPIGLFVFLFNIPLLAVILMKKLFPPRFAVKMLITTAFLSVVMDYVVVWVPVYKGNPLLAAMFGGACMGVGLGLVYLGRSDTGGITLLGLIIQKIKPQFQVGTLMSVLNISVVLASGIFFKNIENVLYAVVMVYISGFFMNHLVDSATAKKLMIVIADSTDRVRQLFFQEGAGVTVLKGEGGYSSEIQRVVLCAADKQTCFRLQKQIKAVDRQALIIITETSQVIGKGFKHLM